MSKYSKTKIDIIKSKWTVAGTLICGICYKPVFDGEWNIDHIVPKSKGGSGKVDNLQIAHITCNTKKGCGDSPKPKAKKELSPQKRLIKIWKDIDSERSKRENNCN